MYKSVMYVNIIETFWNTCCSCRHGIGLHHQHRARSYCCVGLGWLNGVTQYWSRNLCGFAYHRSTFDYCSVHVSTVISHVSQQFRFLVFFIVTQRVVSRQCNYFYELEYLSLMVVRVSLRIGLHHQHRARSYSCVGLGWLNGVTQYWSRNLCGFAYHRSTSICTGFRIHHTSLVVRVAISAFVNSLKCKSKVKKTKKQTMAPGFTLRLCPRANKNLHMP
ncbi:hypothetical protein T01_6760 [Trichinella spiralis]|uniref:Uncharacterized protein n=1 Tax=Trichinella spiralis TaxID=6334 RepID=A0A0V1BKD7_TRISP|nr:hypothetical protein T01_6760 [Trichinella spiralis]